MSEPILNLHLVLSERVDRWRERSYPIESFDTIAEILDWVQEPEGAGFRLRPPQIRALETYWYLRLVEETPHVMSLYQRLFPGRADLRKALDVPAAAFERVDYDLDRLFNNIRSEDAFVGEFRLAALRETLTLQYPSYILALAMGAGKTVLIGAIVATEFAMALEYPGGPFVQNALVFAPGKTIIESLRELASIRYDRILPPRLHKPFAASTKLTFTRDGDPDIPVIERSLFNIVVTNTEKIRIQKEAILKSDIGALFGTLKEDEARQEVANRRLQKLASLPHLGIFSDEAHHTYGQALGSELKKVRKTVDYLAEKTDVVCVVNTTGTPYFQRQPLRDVVIWYGLSEGIRDGILKDVAGNIHGYEFDDADASTYVATVIDDFFRDYGDVTLPDGAPARLAMYFPQTDDLAELRPAAEAALARLGRAPDIILENTTRSPKANEDAFNRLQHDPAAPHRVILLVNKGTEGWNCPSLFACALVRRLRSSNNFVLQAASRCLRQVPGNSQPARIYLSIDNRATLDRELRESYGETIEQLNRVEPRSRQTTIRLRKLDVPPLTIRQIVRTVVRRTAGSGAFRLERPQPASDDAMRKVILTPTALGKAILAEIETMEVRTTPQTIGFYEAALELSTTYRIDLWAIYEELVRVYNGQTEIPEADLGALAEQLESQIAGCEVREEEAERALALVRVDTDGWVREPAPEGGTTYTAEISYPVSRESLLLGWEGVRETNHQGFGFHYSPYNFDSKPERSFFQRLLYYMNLHPSQVEDIYYTGALTDPKKTDVRIEYLGEDGKRHHYTPDFVVRRKDGRSMLVEIKGAQYQATTTDELDRYEKQGVEPVGSDGRKAVALKKWVSLNPERLKYELIFARGEELTSEQTRRTRRFVEEGS